MKGFTVRQSSVDKKWRFRFEDSEFWSEPFDSFGDVAKKYAFFFLPRW